MALAHEHVLACQSCNTPLFVKRLDNLNPANTVRTRLVLMYEHTVASILGGASTMPSFLHDMREDTVDPQTDMEPAMTLLHVLHMEGFEKPDSRREFAEYCDLDPAILESHFVTMSRLTGVEIGACWCGCHAGRDPLGWCGTADVEDDFKPSKPVFIVECAVPEQSVIVPDSQDMSYESRMNKKRKRLSLTETRR